MRIISNRCCKGDVQSNRGSSGVGGKIKKHNLISSCMSTVFREELPLRKSNFLLKHKHRVTRGIPREQGNWGIQTRDLMPVAD